MDKLGKWDSELDEVDGNKAKKTYKPKKSGERKAFATLGDLIKFKQSGGRSESQTSK